MRGPHRPSAGGTSMSVMSVRSRAMLCAELCCLVSLSVPRLLAQAENAIPHQRAVVVQISAQDSVHMQQSRGSTEQGITLDLHDVALKDALRAIATQGKVVL